MLSKNLTAVIIFSLWVTCMCMLGCTRRQGMEGNRPMTAYEQLFLECLGRTNSVNDAYVKACSDAAAGSAKGVPRVN